MGNFSDHLDPRSVGAQAIRVFLLDDHELRGAA